MHLCLVEDTLTGQFLPLTHFHPVYDLRCGVFSLQERIIRHLRPSGVSLHCRTSLALLMAEEYAGAERGRISARRSVVVNGRCLMTSSLARTLRTAKPGSVYMAGEEFVAAVLEGSALDAFRKLITGDLVDPAFFLSFGRQEVDARLLQRPWDLITVNEQALEADIALIAGTRKATVRPGVHRSAVLVGKRNIHLGPGSMVGPGAVLDATDGPICVGHRATIHPLAVIQGPVSIGDGAIVNAGARIGAGTTIGPVCKVGGEVQHAIMHSFANKQHDGFLGHSYLAPWVNLGAGTTTSNLKNTYGNISVRAGHRRIDTGLMFLGLIAGDHVRTGINVSLDTGTIAGVSSNIFGSALPPKFIPSFSWGEAGNLTTYNPEKALEVATRAMSRRGIRVTDAYAGVFHHVFQETADERAGARR
jgi:UDP-N-acetylglucosamine diphosphorylase/glucosamine-1-phosphate N-acetyltransferase